MEGSQSRGSPKTSLTIAFHNLGLSKPLLLSRKDDTKGLGTKQHFTSDQWWMNAFDEQLQGLDTSKPGTVTQKVTTGKLNSIDKGSLGKWYLYQSFVRGGLLEGSLGMAEKDTSSTDSDSATPTTSDGTENKRETKEERKARKEMKRRRKEEREKTRAARRERKAAKARCKAELSADADDEKKLRRARKEEKRRKRKEKESKGVGSKGVSS
ncbi:hypothetical protein RJ55_08412 [Drechmeria coniospora]|nr:hypothetical protein RJ55_08412 [Drechmeria coniospora]